MRRIAILIAALVLTFVAVNPRLTGAPRPKGTLQSVSRQSYKPGEIIVKLRSEPFRQAAQSGNYRNGRLGELLRAMTGREPSSLQVEPLISQSLPPAARRVIEQEGLDRTFVVKLANPNEMDSALAELTSNSQVEYAQPNYRLTPGSVLSPPVPNDPKFFDQWALDNPGFNVDGYPCTRGADIKALEAWQITTGSPNVLIAVIDSGIDITHPDLAANIYVNEKEIPGNGIDDDHNGYIDDVNGFNVADWNGDVSDVLGHGTQMAGIIGAVLNNGIGISGMSQCRILPVKFFKRTGPGPLDIDDTVADAAKGVIYAIAAGASIINASWSTTSNPGSVLKDAFKAANDADILVVCIAGNDAFNNDTNPVWPGHYELPNQIVVAASDYNDLLWHVLGVPTEIKSGYGTQTVQIAAPGSLVWTTIARGDCPLCSQSETPTDWYGEIDGTSAAAAYVSAVAALVKSQFPEANAPVLRRRILEGADSISQLVPYVASGARLDALGALTVQLQITAPTVTKVKYKINKSTLLVYGNNIQRGAHVLVNNDVYSTTPTAGTFTPLTANVPNSEFPPGVPVQVVLRNPDGGVSQAFTVTK